MGNRKLKIRIPVPTIEFITSEASSAASSAVSDHEAEADPHSQYAEDTDLSAHINDTTDAHDASAISYNGGVGMAATDVEAAVDELATEKANTASAVMDGDAAGGVLSGTYPNPGFAADMATQAELDAHKTSGDHDGRYYTETEVDTLPGGKSNTGHTHALDDLSDVDLTGATDGEVLKRVAGVWMAEPDATGGGGGATDLNDLTDVNDSIAPAAGDYLRHDGTDWKDSPLLEADIPAAIARDAEVAAAYSPIGHAHAAGDTTSGTFADARIPTHDIITKHTGFPGGTTNFLRADGSFAAPPGGSGGTEGDALYHRHVGTSPFERWYYLTSRNTVPTLTAGTVSTGFLYATPFVVPRGGTLDRIGVEITTAVAAQTFRVGIYSATSATNIYPNARVLDSGALSAAATGLVSATISQALTGGTLYWAIVASSHNNIAMRLISQNDHLQTLGVGTAALGTFHTRLHVAQAYGALPANYPAGATLAATAWVGVFGRFSA